MILGNQSGHEIHLTFKLNKRGELSAFTLPCHTTFTFEDFSDAFIQSDLQPLIHTFTH